VLHFHVDAVCFISLEEEEEVGSVYQRHVAFLPQLDNLSPPSREIDRPTGRRRGSARDCIYANVFDGFNCCIVISDDLLLKPRTERY
jgi:hypothetical protein